MKTVLSLWMGVILLVSVTPVFADGKVFSRAVAVPTTPDQRALLYYSNGVERLVIETSFVGEGTNFAWIVPFPSVPTVEPVSPGFFPALNVAFQPRLVHNGSTWWVLFLLAGVFLSASILSYRRGRGLGLLTWILFCFLLLLAFLLILPNFVRARSAGVAPAASPITLHQWQQVGIYNTVTLSSPDGVALVQWLNTNGFHTPTNLLPVISSYSTQGWSFVAATVNRDDSASGYSQPHPLAFTFKSEHAIYPLRLTGVDNEPCTIELFVFGQLMAEADNFQIQYCGLPFASPLPIGEDEEWQYQREHYNPPRPGEFRIINPEVRRWALPAPSTTKLVGTLHSHDMRSDAIIRWVPVKTQVPTLFSYKARTRTVLNWTLGVFVVGCLLLQLRAPKLDSKKRLRGFLTVILLALTSGAVSFATLKTTPIQEFRGHYGFAIHELRSMMGSLEQFKLERKSNSVLGFQELQTASTNYLKWGLKNTFTLEPIRQEPTPGNITLTTNQNSVDVFWYDINSIPFLLESFEIHSSAETKQGNQ